MVIEQTGDDRDPLSGRIIGCAIEVHRALGPGLLESAYEECLAYELTANGLHIARQVPLPVVYKGVRLECGYRIDMIVQGTHLLELKAVEALIPIYEAQVLTYLRLRNLNVGLLINFHTRLLRDGIKRLVL